eukprot:11095137-Lingulodinium_polyedra.AAC.1
MRRSTTTSRMRRREGGTIRRNMGWRCRAYGWRTTFGTCSEEALSPYESRFVVRRFARCC